MVTIRPNDSIATTAEGFPTGLAGSGIWVRVVDHEDNVVAARSMDFIIERDPSSLGYRALIPAPTGGWPVDTQLQVIWDNVSQQVSDDQEYLVLLWRPTVGDVGAKLRARTRENGSGAEAGTFTTKTRPTADEVESFIEGAVLDVQMEAGAETFDTPLAEYVRRIATTRAAMDVELSYHPDAADESGSAYDSLSDQFDKGIQALVRRIAQSDGGPSRGARIRSIALVAPDGLNDPSGWR